MKEALERLNALSQGDAEAELLKCCGSTKWARGVALRRSFHRASELFEAADSVWMECDERDWLEAFSAHPKIGGRKASTPQTADAARWSEDEQAGVRDAASETLQVLAESNLEYERKFGFIFIVCATGKSSEEMLELLKARLPNEPDVEIRIAAEEQRRITHLRLEKLLSK